LATTFIPSAWVDDALIIERKSGLAEYLSALLSSPDYADSPILANFFAPDAVPSSTKLNPEDAVPSTLSRKATMGFMVNANEVEAQATPVAAAYYPDWSADSNPPEKIDFSIFDILLFGWSISLSGLLDSVDAINSICHA
jgi:chitinase